MNLSDIKKKLLAGEMTIDLAGHNRHHGDDGVEFAKKEIIDMIDRREEVANDDDKKTQELFKDEMTREREVGDLPFHSTDSFYCFVCGQRYGYILQDENTIGIGRWLHDEEMTDNMTPIEGRYRLELVREVCPLAEGVPLGEGRIKIDSKMVVANFFHRDDVPELADAPEKERYREKYSLNSALGRLNTQKYKAERNIAYGQMGNMSIGVYVSNDKKRVLIADPHYWEDWHFEHDTPEDQFTDCPEGMTFAGTISLSCWRWEATDLDYVKPFEPSCLTEGSTCDLDADSLKKCYNDYYVLDVAQGEWDFVHYYRDREPKEGEWEIYAELTLVED
jgi:hypothetical protein